MPIKNSKSKKKKNPQKAKQRLPVVKTVHEKKSDKAKLLQRSYFIKLKTGDVLHLLRIYKDKAAPAVFMLHGSISNGRVFYSKGGKGLGPFLADAGYDVFIADLRGKGQSYPPVSRLSSYGQTEAILEDIPAFLKKIKQLKKGHPAKYWVAHSWGGVLLASYLARHPKEAREIKAMVFFAVKRSVSVFNWDKFWHLDVLWHRVGPWLTHLWGYLPITTLRLGMDNEPKQFHQHIKQWAKPSPWIDPIDDFDYATEIQKVKLPPVLNLVGEGDTFMGHPSDVYNFMGEMGLSGQGYHILSRKNGNLHDYDHISILTDPDAMKDHFPLLLEWIKSPS
ncbi:MAG: alpha/beta fold hydrolase [Deltaproteobacteria bacterium]|nr:alpha/beta fold hydrolase [Deltaproteobacteria bacterium]